MKNKKENKDTGDMLMYFKSLANSLESCELFADTNQSVLFVNTAFEKIFKQTIELKKKKKLSLSEVLKPADPNKLSSVIQLALSGKQTIVKDFKFQINSDNTSRKELQIFPVGNQTDIFGLHIRINDCAKKSSESIEINNFTKALLNHLPVPVFYKNIEGKYLGCNPAFENHTGKKQSEIIGKTVFEIWQTKQARTYHKKDLDLMQNKKYQSYISTVYDSKSNLRDVQFYKTVFFDKDNNPQGIIGVYTDITEIKQIQTKLETAKADLQEKKDTLQFLFENMIQGVVLQNQIGEIIFSNKSAEKILGLSLKQIQGKKSLDPLWKSIYEDGSPFPGSEHPAMQSLETGKTIYNTIMGVFNSKNNVYTWIRIDSIPRIKNNETKPYQVITIFEDITAVRKTTQELIYAKEQAEQSSKLKTAFLHNISHAVRTPMNSIMGFTKMLDKPGHTEKEKSQFRKIILENAEQLLNTIEDILAVSLIQKKLEILNLEKVCINTMLYELSETFESTAHKKNLELIIKENLPETSVIIKTDKEKLKKILYKLIDNAIKFTHKGYVEADYITEEKAEGNVVIFKIADTGIGIDMKLQDTIFSSFQQPDESLDNIHNGIGLGLSIAKAYAELLGGIVFVKSAPNKGSTFYLSIPYESMEKRNSKPDNTGIDKHKKSSILIAEDEKDNFLYMKVLLENYNVEIINAVTGNQAIELCKENKNIQLVLMDIRMPELNGYDAAEAIKQFRPELPIIAQTAYASPGSKDDFDLPYFDGFIRKPIDEDNFYEIINKYIK